MKVLVTNHVPEDVLEPLAGLAEVILGPSGGDLMPREAVLALAPSLDGIINQAELRVDAELLKRAPRLRIVANVARGHDNLDLELMARRGVWATNAGDVFAESTADATLALILAVTRRLGEAERFVRQGLWKGFQPGRWDGMLLAGKTLGIVGYGAIGRAVRRRAEAFGMRVLFHRRKVTLDPAQKSLDEIIAESDILSLHCSLTPHTCGLLDAARFREMKPGAILVNMARGAVVCEEALVAALDRGQLAGAGLDVFEHEPAVHPRLVQMEQVVLTPHLGGGTRESRAAARRVCAADVAAVLRGEAPMHALNQPDHIGPLASGLSELPGLSLPGADDATTSPCSTRREDLPDLP